MKKINVYKVDENLKTLYKVLIAILVIVLIPLLIWGVAIQKAILLYIALGIITTAFIVAMITFPVLCWVEKKKQDLRDTENCFETYNRF